LLLSFGFFQCILYPFSGMDSIFAHNIPDEVEHKYTIRIFLITNHQPLFHIMHHLTCGISSLLHSVNLILFTVLLVHLTLRISPHHSHHLRSHHLSLPLPSTPDLKLISFTNPFLHSRSYSFRLTSQILTCTELKRHCLFVLVSGYVC